MKNYLIDTFRFNDHANNMVLKKIKELPDKTASIKFFSHLINSQNKWMQRILNNPEAPTMSWWDPVYDLNDLEKEWSSSLQIWLDYLESKTEEELVEELTFIGFDGDKWAATAKDIALQLNYHSIHHRAQIQTLIRQQGLEPDFVDYIGTKYRKLS
ncbi:DinB family protein [Solitalea koreensis]|nr:DinB family protein [Solitalea koreensis]